jgi:hypothetical protein
MKLRGRSGQFFFMLMCLETTLNSPGKMYPFTAMEEGNSACTITTSDLAIVGLSTTGTFNLLLYDWLINFIFIFICIFCCLEENGNN